MSPAQERSQPVDVAELIRELAAQRLASKGRGEHLEPLAEAVWRAFLDRLLTADERFVRSPGGIIELAQSRDQRHAAITREPAKTPEPEAAHVEQYAVAATPGVNR
jgi:hypothetical protein